VRRIHPAAFNYDRSELKMKKKLPALDLQSSPQAIRQPQSNNKSNNEDILRQSYEFDPGVFEEIRKRQYEQEEELDVENLLNDLNS